MNSFKRKIGEAVRSDKFSASTITAMIIAIAAVFNILLYVIVEYFGIYWYAEQRDDLTLTGNTDALFEEAINDGKKVKISFCMSDPKDLEADVTGTYVYETARYFQERYPEFIELDFINLITRLDKNGNFVNLDKYTKDMRGNEVKVIRSSVIFECGENYRVVTDTYTSGGFAPFYTMTADREPTSYNGEEVMAAMISWVLTEEHKTAYFTQYHGEVADIAFSNLLSCAGYYVDVIDLRKNYVPENADLVVISNPTGDFETAREGTDIKAEIQKLDIYMQNGGRLYVSLDPYVKSLPVLEGFLEKWGIKFSTTKFEDSAPVRNMVKDNKDAITADGFTLVTGFADSEPAKIIADKVSGYSSGGILIREACALELSGNAKPILVSSSASELYAAGKTVATGGNYCVGAYSEITSGDKTSRVFVVPSVYLAVSDSLVSSGYSNKDFVYALLDEFYGADKVPYGCRAIIYNDQVLQNLTMGRARVYTALIMSVPIILALVCIVVVVRRKRR